MAGKSGAGVKRSVKWSLLMNVHVTCSITLIRTDINKHDEDPSRTYTTNTTLTINTLWQRHEGQQRVKYTTGNELDWKQVCGKTRQNQWKMKNGSMMARRPVTSTAEHRPNKERQRLRQKSWHLILDLSVLLWIVRYYCTVGARNTSFPPPPQ